MPRWPRRGRKPGKRGKAGVGVFPVLKRLGVIAGASPGLCEKAVLAVLHNTFEEAADGFRRFGVPISAKRLRTIAKAFSQAALAARRQRLESPPEPAGNASQQGRRLAVTIDGGRIRTREAKRRGRGFHADWKEPKVFTIYELDGQGRKKRDGLVVCDGTIAGPEPLIRLLSAELVRHGAAAALEVVIIADGAPWIWNHLDRLIALAGLDPAKVTRILDFYHAAEHLKAMAELLFKSPPSQNRWFRRMRGLLRTRSPKIFMGALAKSLGNCRNRKLAKEQAYFKTNLAAINYRQFRRRKMPIGSGVIESAIRRIVNLRLKGAGMFWLKENAEGFLHLRCQLKTGNWDAFFADTLDKLSRLD